MPPWKNNIAAVMYTRSYNTVFGLKMVLLVAFFATVYFHSLHVTAKEIVECEYHPSEFASVCCCGVWPENLDVQLNIATNLLVITYVTVQQYSAISAVPYIRRFELFDCRYYDNKTGKLQRFPFASFTKYLNRETVTSLIIKSTFLEVVSKADFSSFSRLRALWLIDCGIVYFDPDTLEAFLIGEPPNRYTLFTHFHISNDSSIRIFPWHSLRVVAEVLEQIDIISNANLTSLSSPFQGEGEMTNWTLTELDTVLFEENGNFVQMPAEAFDVLVRPTTYLSYNVFTSCLACERHTDLLRWVRSPGTRRAVNFCCKHGATSLCRFTPSFWWNTSDPYCEGIKTCESIVGSVEPLEATCSDGTWPAATEPVMDEQTQYLMVNNMSFYQFDAQVPILSLQPVPFLSRLVIRGCVFRNVTNERQYVEPFPLRAFTARLNDTSIRVLHVENTLIRSLGIATFFNLGGLEEIQLRNCNLSVIRSDAFEIFGHLPASISTTEDARQQKNLAILIIEDDKVLSYFHLDVLLPVSHSVQVLSISNNKKMEYVGYNRTVPCGLTLTRARNISVVGNGVTHDLAVDIFTVLRHNNESEINITFEGNQNPCSPCAVFSNLAWASSSVVFQNAVTQTRNLQYSCLEKENGSVVHLTTDGGNVLEYYDQWYDQCMDDLQEEVNRTTEVCTEPTTTAASTTAAHHMPSSSLATSTITSTTVFDEEQPPWKKAWKEPLIYTSLACGISFVVVGVILCRRRQSIKYNRHDWRWDDVIRNVNTEKTISLADQYFPGESAIKQEVRSLTVDSKSIVFLNKILGKGSQGTIVQATATGLKGGRKEVTVAVKTFHSFNLSPQDTNRLFVEEFTAMVQAGFHSNLVNLLEVTEVARGPALLLEFCEQGALLSFLIEHRGPLYYNHVTEDGVYESFDEEAGDKQQDLANQLFAQEGIHVDRSTCDTLILSSKDLLCFAYQIARAMEYLARRSIIHRDLAARNILVTSRRLVKIADFGLARVGDNVYVMESDAGLPVRWMPPETMVNKCFSECSDVWSYGVLLWEMFSLGEMPYSDFLVAHGKLRSFVSWLEAGHRLERPPGTPSAIYELLKSCWASSPAGRPTFAEIRTKLDDFISEEVVSEYLQMSRETYGFLQLETKNEEQIEIQLVESFSYD